MKKALAILAVLLVVGFSAFAANNAARTNIDFSSAVYLNTDRFGILTLNTSNGNSSFNFALNGDLSAIFKDGFGAYAYMGLNLSNGFDLYVAGAYKLKLNNSVNLTLTAGPTFIFTRNSFTFGTDVLAHFDYKVVKNWFLRFTLGANMDFFTNDKNGNKLQGFRMMVQLPQVAIGYSF